MTTSDDGGPPSPVTHAGILASQAGATTPGAVPNATVPSPGLATAEARVPGGPSLPDHDPASLSLAIQQLANEMFVAPPSPMTTTDASSATPTLLGSPSMQSTPQEGGLLSLAAPASPSPFTAVPQLDTLSAMPLTTSDVSYATPPSPSPLPQLDVLAPTEVPAFDAPVAEQGELYWLPQGPVAPAIAVEPFDVQGKDETSAIDGNAVRQQFPILQERVHGKRLVWLDNAATTQKPQVVIDRIKRYYEHENSNVHRAAHTLAARATDAYEGARETTRKFLGASQVEEIVFVRGATEGINLVAQSWGRRNVEEGDEVLITWLEHHANIVPWQMLCREKRATLKVAPVDDRGAIILEEFERLLSPRTRIVAFPQVSNALGTITPAREMIEMAHRHGAVVLLDGAQAVSHMPVDVQLLDCDFYVFSGHKVFAPTGIGVVYGKRDLLDAMPPWQGGGNMIRDVTFERTTYQGSPWRFEAGTGSIGDAAGLGAALDWLDGLGRGNVERYEHELLAYATECLLTVPGLTIIGTAPEKAGVISFVLDGQKTEEVGGLLDQEGIAVRSGHHCAQPILRRFGLESTVRASLAPYNTREDIDALTAALKRLQLGRAAVD
jgi:cysteine desulfurase/selenocysteine lyase